jgi:succinyl-CoA synthetase beta subunit
MRLTEATAKTVLARAGLPAPEGRLVLDAAEAEWVSGEGAVFAKAQVAAGDRARSELVRRVDDPARLRAEVGRLLGRVVDGTPVAAVLVEAAVEPELELYVGVHVDDATCTRVLRVGSGAGAGYRPEDAELRLELPVAGVELFQLRKAVGALGLTGARREAVARAALAVTEVARDWHTYVVEVNPLFVTADGAVAIDAKIELDDYSLERVPAPELVPTRSESVRERAAREYQTRDHRGSFKYVQLVHEQADPDGHGRLVGSHSVGGGESLVVFDALQEAGLRPANYCDTSGAPSREKVAFAAELIASQPHIAGYFFSSCIANQPLSVTAAGLVAGLDAAAWDGPTVVRIAGIEEDEARAAIAAWARDRGVPAEILGRESDEWEAASTLARLIGDGTRG